MQAELDKAHAGGGDKGQEAMGRIAELQEQSSQLAAKVGKQAEHIKTLQGLLSQPAAADELRAALCKLNEERAANLETIGRQDSRIEYLKEEFKELEGERDRLQLDITRKKFVIQELVRERGDEAMERIAELQEQRNQLAAKVDEQAKVIKTLQNLLSQPPAGAAAAGAAAAGAAAAGAAAGSC